MNYQRVENSPIERVLENILPSGNNSPKFSIIVMFRGRSSASFTEIVAEVVIHGQADHFFYVEFKPNADPREGNNLVLRIEHDPIKETKTPEDLFAIAEEYRNLADTQSLIMRSEKELFEAYFDEVPRLEEFNVQRAREYLERVSLLNEQSRRRSFDL